MRKETPKQIYKIKSNFRFRNSKKKKKKFLLKKKKKKKDQIESHWLTNQDQPNISTGQVRVDPFSLHVHLEFRTDILF